MRPRLNISSLQSHRQPLEQEGSFSAVLSDVRDASPDLLHQFYCLMTPRACCRDSNREKMCLFSFQVPKFWGSLPKKYVSQKRAKLESTSDNFTVRSERIEISKIEKLTLDSDSSRVRRKTFDELWSRNNKVGHVNLDPPKLTFSENYISAHRGRWPMKFLHVLENGQGLLNRSHRVNQQFSYNKNVKKWPTTQRMRACNFGDKGSNSNCTKLFHVTRREV